jgi:ABC-type nickel/cobalt efflux system permease component RcnA
MNNEVIALSATAVSIAFLHTIAGPDHYLPFIVMSKARNWSRFRTILITILCGIGHVGSSIVIGAIGIAFGLSVAHLQFFEGYRGNVAAWAFIIFGFVYFAWGLWKGIRNKKHNHHHPHIHEDGSFHKHVHSHKHSKEHNHEHPEDAKVNLTPWILFTIFVLGPCEPMIPLLMLPAAKQNTAGVVLVAIVFSITTISTMIAMVLLPLYGLKMIPIKFFERYMHAVAGFTILICGLGIVFLGL